MVWFELEIMNFKNLEMGVLIIRLLSLWNIFNKFIGKSLVEVVSRSKVWVWVCGFFDDFMYWIINFMLNWFLGMRFVVKKKDSEWIF